MQLTEFNGFAVVDFATLRGDRPHRAPEAAAGQGARARRRQLFARHGRDGGQQALDRRHPLEQRGLCVLAYLTLLGIDVGIAPDWVTLTPDGKTAYVANAGSNDVSVVDMVGLREVTRISVGQVPKRNITAMRP